jgi:hypothetical protein
MRSAPCSSSRRAPWDRAYRWRSRLRLEQGCGNCARSRREFSSCFSFSRSFRRSAQLERSGTGVVPSAAVPLKLVDLPVGAPCALGPLSHLRRAFPPAPRTLASKERGPTRPPDAGATGPRSRAVPPIVVCLLLQAYFPNDSLKRTFLRVSPGILRLLVRTGVRGLTKRRSRMSPTRKRWLGPRGYVIC